MSATEIIKINESMKLLLFKNSFKLDIQAGVAYFPDISIIKLKRESDLFVELPKMLLAAYNQGVNDTKREMAAKYKEFKTSFSLGGA